MTTKIYLKKIFALLGFLGVVLGAFGAHKLQSSVSPEFLDIWKTATLYLFVHVLAGLYSLQSSGRLVSAYCFLFGILIFSGSLYMLVCLQQPSLGMVTPIGGVAFMFGWVMLMFNIKK